MVGILVENLKLGYKESIFLKLTSLSYLRKMKGWWKSLWEVAVIEGQGLPIRRAVLWILVPPFTSRVSLGTFLTFSEFHFPHKINRDRFTESLRR